MRKILLFSLFLFFIAGLFAQTDFYYSSKGEQVDFKIKKNQVIFKCHPETDIKTWIETTNFISAYLFAEDFVIATFDTLETNIDRLKRDRNIADIAHVLEYAGGAIQMPTYKIFVKVKKGQSIESIFEYAGLTTSIKNITLFNPYRETYLVELNVPLEDILQVCRILFESGRCEFVEPDFIRKMKQHPVNASTNPLKNGVNHYPKQWGLNNTGQDVSECCEWEALPGIDIKAEAAWRITKGNQNITIAVIDNGVQLDHPDLALNLLEGYDATDHSNGNSYGGNSGSDYHGTMCAGVIGAIDDSVGIVGVAPNCKIVPIRIGYKASKIKGSVSEDDRDWHSLPSWQATAIRHAWETAKVDVISLSWGQGDKPVTPAMQVVTDAIAEAIESGRDKKGCIVVAAAGNYDGDSRPVDWPADLPNVIAVGAIKPTGKQSDYSRYLEQGIHVVAPGCCVYSTALYTGPGSGYRYFHGTSLACPHVAGVAALVLSVKPCLTHEEVKKIIALSCEKIYIDCLYEYTYSSKHKYGAWNAKMGYGLVNAHKAVMYALAPPPEFFITSQEVTNISDTLELKAWMYQCFEDVPEDWHSHLRLFGNFMAERYEITATINYPYTSFPVVQGSANGFSVIVAPDTNNCIYFIKIDSITNTTAIAKTYVYKVTRIIYDPENVSPEWIPVHPDSVRFHISVMHGNLYHKLYLQNHVETSTQNYSVITDIIAGKNVKPGETVGDYVIQSGANVVFHAGENIVFTDGFIAAEGSNFIAYVDPFFTCTHTTTAPPKGNNSEPVPVIESFSVEAINSLNSEEPVTEKEYYLKLYPNPSTGNVTIEYNLSKSELVEISLHDNFGKLVYNLKNRTPHDAGVYKITFNGVELPTGIYFCTLRTENGQKTEKLMIVR